MVVADAAFCKQCGASLTRYRLLRRGPGFNPGLAFVISVIPGLGQLYRGKPMRAVLWFFGVWWCYAVLFPFGMLIHFICAINAAFAGAIAEDTLAHPRVH